MAPPIKARASVSVCSRCGEEKTIGEFPSRKNSRGYLCVSGRCKTCRNAESAELRARRLAACPKTGDERARAAEYQRDYYQRNKDRVLARTKARHAAVGNEIKREQTARWRAANRGRYRATANELQKRMLSDPDYKVRVYLRGRIRRALKQTKKAGRTIELVGGTVEQVRAHLEAQFQPGMSWENHGTHGWHIDHIRPCASFDLADPEQQRQCFHYTNLQPLWAADNLRKHAKY